MAFFDDLLKGASTALGVASGASPVGAIAQIGTSLLGSFLGKKVNDSANIKNQKEMMNYQNTLNMQNWNYQFDKQNARQDSLLLNQPSMQKQGLINAGLSPALMNGGNFNVGAVSNPSGQAVGQSSMSGQSIADLLRLNMESREVQSRIDVNQANAKNIEADTSLKLQQHEYNPKLFLSQIGLNDSVVKKATAEINLMGQQEANAWQQFTIDWQRNERENAESKARIDKLNADTHFVQNSELYQFALWQAQANYYYAQGKLSYAQRNLVVQQLKEAEYRYDNLLPLEKERAQEAINNLKFTNDGLKYDYDVKSSVPPAVRGWSEFVTGSVGPILEAGVDLINIKKNITGILSPSQPRAGAKRNASTPAPRMKSRTTTYYE